MITIIMTKHNNKHIHNTNITTTINNHPTTDDDTHNISTAETVT